MECIESEIWHRPPQIERVALSSLFKSWNWFCRCWNHRIGRARWLFHHESSLVERNWCITSPRYWYVCCMGIGYIPFHARPFHVGPNHVGQIMSGHFMPVPFHVSPISCPSVPFHARPISCWSHFMSGCPNSCQRGPFHVRPISCQSHFMSACPISCPSHFMSVPFHVRLS